MRRLAVRQMKKRKANVSPVEFYELNGDMSLSDRWMLTHPSIIKNNDRTWFNLSLGHRLEVDQSIRIVVSRDAKPLDFTETSLGNLIVSTRTAKLIEALAPEEVQCIEAKIGRKHRGYKALNILDHVDCLDKKLSIMAPRHGDRQDVLIVAINSKKVGSRRIFRVSTWPVCVIVRPIIKEHFERAGITGAVFRPLRSS